LPNKHSPTKIALGTLLPHFLCQHTSGPPHPYISSHCHIR
jgi:hypothetical protein